MENILDHDEKKKNEKQVFAKLTLLSAILTFCSFGAMMYFIASGDGQLDNFPTAIMVFALGYVAFGFLSFVFSFITILLKEAWTIIKIAGIALSGFIFLIFAAGIVVAVFVSL